MKNLSLLKNELLNQSAPQLCSQTLNLKVTVKNFEKSLVCFEMTISTFSLCIGWRELPIFLFPVFGALAAPPERVPCLFKRQNSTGLGHILAHLRPLSPKKNILEYS